MTSTDQKDLTDMMIASNKALAQQWFRDISLLAQQGDARAMELVDMEKTPDGQRTLWALHAHINQALAACAFDVPADDAASSLVLKAIAEKHPVARWVVDEQQRSMPLQELNAELENDAEALQKATKRLDFWLEV